MAKKCFYCKAEIEDGLVVDMCMRCMYQVWGEKMAKAILEGMEKEKAAGNMELGRVSQSGCLNQQPVQRQPVQRVETRNNQNFDNSINNRFAEVSEVSREELNMDNSFSDGGLGENNFNVNRY